MVKTRVFPNGSLREPGTGHPFPRWPGGRLVERGIPSPTAVQYALRNGEKYEKWWFKIICIFIYIYIYIIQYIYIYIYTVYMCTIYTYIYIFIYLSRKWPNGRSRLRSCACGMHSCCTSEGCSKPQSTMARMSSGLCPPPKKKRPKVRWNATADVLVIWPFFGDQNKNGMPQP